MIAIDLDQELHIDYSVFHVLNSLVQIKKPYGIFPSYCVRYTINVFDQHAHTIVICDVHYQSAPCVNPKMHAI